MLTTQTSTNIEQETMKMSSLSAKVAEPFQSMFFKAQVYIDLYFNNRQENAQKGKIEISGERYLMLRADTLALDFFDQTSRFVGFTAKTPAQGQCPS